MAEEKDAAPEQADDAESTPENAEETPVVETDGTPGEDPSLAWKGHKLDEMGGAQVGRVERALLDEATGEPVWFIARMGRFGHYCLVPAQDAVVAIERVWVPFTRDQIRRAPRVDSGGTPPAEVMQATIEHYGLAATNTS